MNEATNPNETPAPAEAAAPAVPVPPPAPPIPTPTPPAKLSNRDRYFGRPRVVEKVVEPVPVRTPEPEMRSKAPSLRELDAEIAGELEAALSGMSEKQLLDAETASNARQQTASAAPDGRKQGKVLSVHGPDVFVEVPGGRSQGVISMVQFPDGPPAPGSTVDISIEGYDRANGLLILSRRGAAVVADWSTVAEGMTVEARVTESNKGGLAVEINGLRGFMPLSQIDLYRVENPDQFVNQRILCLVTEVNPEERNLVVSRRALLEKGREEVRDNLWKDLAEGQIRTGVVRSVREFGAFVDLGGVDGLLHVSEMSWKRVQDPNEIVQTGQNVKVVVLKVDLEKRKISLGLKQLEASPWDNILDKYHSGQVIQGAVTRTMDFGAFVELEPGVEGLVHISELAGRRVFRVTDIVKPGQMVDAKILNIDPEAKRISLSLKAMIPIEAPVAEEEEEEEEEVERKPEPPRKVPLRGGIGQAGMTFEPIPEEEGKS
jgi:small subunit ribosomal protein S1